LEKLHIRKDSGIVHLFYKTTNLINGNFYYGIHSTKNVNDKYLGSGLLIEKAIKKHGRKNFKREIVKTFDTREEAQSYEREIVNEELLKNRNCYNRALGGQGGYLGPEAVEKMRQSKLGKTTWNAGTAKPIPKCECGTPLKFFKAKRCRVCYNLNRSNK